MIRKYTDTFSFISGILSKLYSCAWSWTAWFTSPISVTCPRLCLTVFTSLCRHAPRLNSTHAGYECVSWNPRAVETSLCYPFSLYYSVGCYFEWLFLPINIFFLFGTYYSLKEIKKYLSHSAILKQWTISRKMWNTNMITICRIESSDFTKVQFCLHLAPKLRTRFNWHPRTPSYKYKHRHSYIISSVSFFSPSR